MEAKLTYIEVLEKWATYCEYDRQQTCFDLVGTMSCFVISYLMFHTFPNIIADVMGYNTEKASTDIKDDTQKLWKE